jgi:16S rRNA (guanine(527)-N(7))-methyltransferase RsmG
MKTFEKTLLEEINKIPLEVSDEIIKKILQYDQLLMQWNEKINLTGLKDEKERIIWLYIESLWAASNLDKINHLVDIGCGCGFPGLAIKWWHQCKLTMVESRKKKCLFLNDAVRNCSLKDTEIKNIRFDGGLDFLRGDERQKISISWRAVSLEEKIIKKMEKSLKDKDEILCFFGKESKDYPIIKKSAVLKIIQVKEFPLSQSRFLLQMIKCST